MAKKVHQEKIDPVTMAQAEDIVLRIKRGLQKKTSVSKLSSEMATHLASLKVK
jgi:hypothetical protein